MNLALIFLAIAVVYAGQRIGNGLLSIGAAIHDVRVPRTLRAEVEFARDKRDFQLTIKPY